MLENNELAVVLKLVADQFKGELQSSRGAIGQFNEFLKDWKTQLAAAGTALFAVAKSTANFGEEMLKGSQKAGTTVQSFSALAHAAKMADVDNQQLITAIKALSIHMVEAQQKTGDGEAVFRRLGVSAVDVTGKLRPTEAVLLDLAEVFEKSADGAAKTDAAVKLFGKSGLELVPFLNKGKTEISGLMAEAQRLGLVLSKDDAEAADKFNDALKKLDAQVKGLTVSIGLPLVRGLTDVLQLFTEVEAAVSRAGDELAGFSKHLSEVFGKTGPGQGLMDLFSTLGFGHRKGEGPGANEKALLDALGVNDRVAARRAQEGREVQMGTVKPPMPTTGGTTVDQIAHVKAVLEIWLAGNRALEIQKRLIGEELDLMFRQEQLADEARKAREEKTRAELDAGLAQAARMLEANEVATQRERDGLLENLKAWIAYDDQVGSSTELRMEHQLELVKANLANQLQLTKDQAGQLIEAWKEIDSEAQAAILDQTTLNAQERETIELQTLTQLAAINQKYSGDIFQGWALGLQRYLQDTQSAFGFAAQMAQRTAQFMEQNFRQFFFDAMDGKIKTLKDLFASFANFAKQMIAQVMAQLAVMLAMKAATSAFGGGFGLGGLFGGGALAGGANAGGLFGGVRFASGGPVLGAGNSDTVRAMLTPGEGVLNRRGMQALAQLNAGTVPTSSGMPNVTVNIHNPGRSDRPQINLRRHMREMIVDILYSDSDIRQGFAGA